jgi:hypothetical protein
MHGLPLLS